MSDFYVYLWLIPVLPLLASAVIALLGPKVLRQHSHWPCILAIAGSCVLAVAAAVESGGGWLNPHHTYFPLFQAGEVHVFFELRGDSLTLIMLVMVTFIGTLIAIFAAGYMHGDPGYPRFFAEVSLFIAAMTLLVSGNNLILLYAGWEGVGLCSYLLIGFWFTKPAAADAARKAFLVTRIGDAGLMLGILLIWSSFDYHLDYDSIFQKAREYANSQTDSNLIFWVCFLLFCGAAGKSAQFPLHVWLPDAMEGPTPVSALIHAATMVTAGVYLVARCTPLFALSPGAQIMVASVGGFTAIFAALIALTQNDLKRVLAYSTLSQLGYMFLALGSAIAPDGGGRELTTFAVGAAMFHLFTHAFFKALLFLSAGSVMHAMGNVIDMRRFGGLRKVLPHTHWTFLCGALALAGFPLLSGFWSKDEILDAVLQASEGQTAYAGFYWLLLIVGLVTAALTAFYTFRAYFMTFWGELRLPPEAGHHGHGDHDDHGHAATTHHAAGQGQAHESPYIMTVPLMILAVFAVGVGAALGPLGSNTFAHYLQETLTQEPYGFGVIPHKTNWLMMGASTVIALGGIGLAYYFYVAQPALPRKVATSLQSLYQLSLNKFYIDEIYEAIILKPLNVVTRSAKTLDQYGIDSVVDLIGQLPRLLGSVFQPVQNGLVQYYALTMMVGLVVFLIALIRNL